MSGHVEHPKSLDEELAEAEKALAKLEEAHEAETKTNLLEIAKHRLRFATEIGKEGRDFAVVATGEGLVVVKRVSAIVSKRWRDAVMADKPLTPLNAYEYVASGVVVPEADVFKRWHDANDFVSTEVANALTGLYRASEDLRKKGR
jgi:hypothetical protein